MINSDLTHTIIGCAYNVYNSLGPGFLEKTYENALVYELNASNISISQQHPIKIRYRNHPVGNYYADIIADNKVIIELKACQAITSSHKNQLLNYLKTTELKVGLLINFGESGVSVQRMVN